MKLTRSVVFSETIEEPGLMMIRGRNISYQVEQ